MIFFANYFNLIILFLTSFAKQKALQIFIFLFFKYIYIFTNLHFNFCAAF